MVLYGKVALITGASRGIGKAIAKSFSAQGAQIAIGARTSIGYENVLSDLPYDVRGAKGFLLDVTKSDQVKDAVEEVITRFGRIDILVNCAGISINDTPTWQTTIQEWDKMMSVNLRGTFLCCSEVSKHMVERQSGVIINIGSSSGRGADDTFGPYTATKWGIIGYTTSLAKSLRPYGIRVNGINPGWVDTDMTRAIKPEGDPEWSTPEEIADVAVFLAAKAPRDMTGQFIDVFGSTSGP